MHSSFVWGCKAAPVDVATALKSRCVCVCALGRWPVLCFCHSYISLFWWWLCVGFITKCWFYQRKHSYSEPAAIDKPERRFSFNIGVYAYLVGGLVFPKEVQHLITCILVHLYAPHYSGHIFIHEKESWQFKKIYKTKWTVSLCHSTFMNVHFPHLTYSAEPTWVIPSLLSA